MLLRNRRNEWHVLTWRRSLLPSWMLEWIILNNDQKLSTNQNHDILNLQIHHHHSVYLRSHLQLHLHMRKVLSWNLSCQKCHHCVKGSVVSVELSSCLHQRFPVLRVFTQVVLVQLHAYFLQFWVEAHHELFVLGLICDFISDWDKLWFCFFEDEISKENTVCIVWLDDIDCDVKSSSGLTMLFQDVFFQGSLSVLLILACVLTHLSWISSDVIGEVRISWRFISVLFLQERSSTLSRNLQIVEVWFRLTE